MNSSILKEVLKQYEQKRLYNISEFENRKKELYKSEPQLKKIEDKLNLLSINTAKLILQNNSEQYIKKLKSDIDKLKDERKKIFKNLGIPENYLSIKYDCKLCKDTGYIINGSKTIMCNCLKQKIYNIEYNQKNINDISNQTFDNFNDKLYSNSINESLYHSKFSPRENISIIKKASMNFVNGFNDSSMKNLIFTGPTGLGKTFISNCIINELLKKGKTILYQTAPVMLDNLISDLFSKPENQIGLSKSLLSVDLLVIDDLGTESLNSMKFTELYKIINTRLLNTKTKTIISTNLDLKSLLNTYDERLVSRFIGFYDIYNFYGEDIRLKKQH